MAEIPHGTPRPSARARSSPANGQGADQPAVKGAEAERSGMVGSDDTAGDDVTPYPDPDEYADPDAQGARSPEDGAEH